VPIRVPSLRDRKEDILLLFRKFVVDFSEKYKTTAIQLDEEAKNLLTNHSWQGNVRELKNIAEQISVLSANPAISGNEMRKFLPDHTNNRLPVLAGPTGEFANEREILYKLFFDMKKDVTELKKMFLEIMQNPSLAGTAANFTKESLLNDFHNHHEDNAVLTAPAVTTAGNNHPSYLPTGSQPVILHDNDIHQHEEIEESLNIMDKEKELIVKALKKHKGKRKDASLDLGISERTLYRKLKEYDIDE
jgi:DNA-binding NtrC family response regulator